MKDVQQAINAQMNDVAPDLKSDKLSSRSETIHRQQSKPYLLFLKGFYNKEKNQR